MRSTTRLLLCLNLAALFAACGDSSTSAGSGSDTGTASDTTATDSGSGASDTSSDTTSDTTQQDGSGDTTNPGTLPIGEPCASDENCASGICYTTQSKASGQSRSRMQGCEQMPWSGFSGVV